MRTALVGCGNMGKNFVRGLRDLPECELVAGCDIAEGQVQSFTKEFPKAKGYVDLAKMLAEEKPEAVMVSSNCVNHAPRSIRCAEAGVRGIYCEEADGHQYGRWSNHG
jgi:predicted dehydrogenase